MNLPMFLDGFASPIHGAVMQWARDEESPLATPAQHELHDDSAAGFSEPQADSDRPCEWWCHGQ